MFSYASCVHLRQLTYILPVYVREVKGRKTVILGLGEPRGMDRLLVSLTRKYLYIDLDSSTDENSYLRGKVSVNVIESLRGLIRNRSVRRAIRKEVSRNVKSTDPLKNIEKTVGEVEKCTFDLWKQRSRFTRFQRNTEQDWNSWVFARRDVEEDSRRVFAMKIGKSSLKQSSKNTKTAVRRNCIEREIYLLESRLSIAIETHRSKENELHSERFERKGRCVNQLTKYDEKIATLYRCKISLLLNKNYIEIEYTAIRSRLIEQRSLHDRLQEERKLTIMKASLAKIESFRENRAAKIIQRNWRLYLMRVSSKKKKGRK